MNTEVKPRVSVLMPVYNAEEFLEDSAGSILAQTFTDFELLLLDDGSKDKSLEIAKKLAEKDSRVRVLPNEANMGIVKTLNRGISLARGEFLARMDSDDFSLPERFAEQVKYLDEHPDYSVCGSWVVTFGNHNGNVWELPSDPNLVKVTMLFYSALTHPAIMMRKKVIFEDLALEYEGYHGEDYILMMKVAKRSKLSNVPKVLFKYRTHDNSLMVINGVANQEVANGVRMDQLKSLGITPTEEEFEIHKKFGRWGFEDSAKFLEESKIWFRKIIAANKESSYYDQDTLIKFLNTKLLDAYKGIKVKYSKGIIKLFFWDLSSGLSFYDRLGITLTWVFTFFKKLI
ncbi:MAG: glycosyltransferase family 2 protein [Candidatus Dojkabacteria bacterium]